jgi:pimeloyl-ACP methyl ester carboxylesterase
MSLYWAAGGLIGGDTLGVEIDRLARQRDPAFVGGLWAAVALKAVAAGLALGLVESWGRRLPRRLLLVLGGVTGAAITLYAAANFIQHTLMATGAIGTPNGTATLGRASELSAVPTGVAVFHGELGLSVRRIAERTHNIVHWSELDRGGHFPAMEEPDLLVDDLREFFRRFR